MSPRRDPCARGSSGTGREKEDPARRFRSMSLGDELSDSGGGTASGVLTEAEQCPAQQTRRLPMEQRAKQGPPERHDDCQRGGTTGVARGPSYRKWRGPPQVYTQVDGWCPKEAARKCIWKPNAANGHSAATMQPDVGS